MKPDWKKQLQAMLPAAMRDDPKKAAILAGLAIVMTGVLLKQFVLTGHSSAPSMASAATGAAPKTAPAAPPKKKIDSTPPQSNAVSTWLTQPIKALDRNLFEFKPEFYPRTSSVMVTSARVVQDGWFFDQLAKSMSARADSRKQRQIRIENLQLAAGKLRVQSTIMGAVPRAMVDGRMIGMGTTIEVAGEDNSGAVQFKVIGIEARRIVIERDGIHIEVPMGVGKARVLEQE